MEITFEVVKGEQTFRKNARILQNYADSNSSYVLGVLFINVRHPSFILIDKYDDSHYDELLNYCVSAQANDFMDG